MVSKIFQTFCADFITWSGEVLLFIGHIDCSYCAGKWDTCTLQLVLWFIGEAHILVILKKELFFLLSFLIWCWYFCFFLDLLFVGLSAMIAGAEDGSSFFVHNYKEEEAAGIFKEFFAKLSS